MGWGIVEGKPVWLFSILLYQYALRAALRPDDAYLFTYMSVFLCRCIHRYVYVPPGARRGPQMPWSWPHGGCEPFSVDAGNPTQLFHE